MVTYGSYRGSDSRIQGLEVPILVTQQQHQAKSDLRYDSEHEATHLSHYAPNHIMNSQNGAIDAKSKRFKLKGVPSISEVKFSRTTLDV